MKHQINLVNCVAIISTKIVAVDTFKKKNKQKSNVFQQIIWSIFDIAKNMWNQYNKDHHCCENGNAIPAIVKTDQTIKKLYGIHDLVMFDDVYTYFNVNIVTHLNNLLHLKQSWVTRWQKFIYASVKRTKWDTKQLPGQTWKYCNRENVSCFFVHQH